MNKLELKHLAPYLPYGLKVLRPDGRTILELIGIIAPSEIMFIERFSNLSPTRTLGTLHKSKPILRPLSDITKEIEVNGEKIVPELWIKHFVMKKEGYSYYCTAWLRELQYRKDFSKNGYWLFEKLFEWHFDVFGLIPKGLAIDINTLDK